MILNHARMKYVVMISLTAAFVVWLVGSGQGAQVMIALGSLSAPLLLLLFAGMIVTYLLRALRVYYEFGDATRGRFAACLQLVLTHNALVNLLPMRAGELSFPVLLKREFGVPMMRSGGSLLWLRAQDAIILAALSVVVWPGLDPLMRIAGVFLLILGGVLLPHVAQRLLSQFSTGKLGTLCAALADSAHHARIGWLWTIANWVVKLTVLSQVFAQLLTADWQVGAAGAVGGELAAISPVQGVAGIGSYEAGAAAALKLSGIAWVDGLKAAFSLHLLVLASALVSAGIALLASAIFRNRVASNDARTNKPSQET
jgi:hypothetical protein